MSDPLQPLWTVAHKVPSSMGFSRQEHWSGLPFPSPSRRLLLTKENGDLTGDGKSEHQHFRDQQTKMDWNG